MLTVDPERRATIPQIREHAWLRACAAAAAADSERAGARARTSLLTGAASSGASPSEGGQAEGSLLAGMAHLELAPPPGECV